MECAKLVLIAALVSQCWCRGNYLQMGPQQANIFQSKRLQIVLTAQDMKCGQCTTKADVDMNVKDSKMPPSNGNGLAKYQPNYKYPFLVFISGYDYDDGLSRLCDGVILSQTFVLTAAHCLVGWESGSLYVSFPSIDGKNLDFELSQMIIHPGFKQNPQPSNDIALLKINGQFNCSRMVRPICLPPSADIVRIGEVVKLAGYFKEKNGNKVLMEGTTLRTSPADCQNQAGDFCTKGRDRGACGGDSGSSAFVMNNDVYYTLGPNMKKMDADCNPNSAVAFADAFFYSTWIRTNVKDLPTAVETYEVKYSIFK